ncbi:MAG: YggS family pyridoxal phosphate-dependent enzyme [Clostridia bacterium]|nr:YggS family pyridoxal phosphate-dependent enzyme [Clostridia bacterium]
MINTTAQQSKNEIVQRISDIRKRINDAQTDSPHGQAVTLMAVTKTVDADRINAAIEQGGIRCIGENRVQELCEKYPYLHLDGVSVHLIGTLQSNKVKYIIDKVDMIHSLDSLTLAKEIEKQAAKHNRMMDCLIEINIGEELSKGGIAPTEDALFSFYDEAAAFPHIRIRGVMTIAPNSGDNEQYHRHFSKTKDLFDRLCREKLPADRDWEPVLSMGMSGSFEEAIRCGSHIVRVGSGIFGARK